MKKARCPRSRTARAHTRSGTKTNKPHEAERLGHFFQRRFARPSQEASDSEERTSGKHIPNTTQAAELPFAHERPTPRALSKTLRKTLKKADVTSRVRWTGDRPYQHSSVRAGTGSVCSRAPKGSKRQGSSSIRIGCISRAHEDNGYHHAVTTIKRLRPCHKQAR